LAGQVDPVPLPAVLSDDLIQATLGASISNEALGAPDANRLYFVFVEPSVNVATSFGTSATDFYGYTSELVVATVLPVNCAVVHYPVARNGTYPALTLIDTVTKGSAQELAESVTGPQGDGIGRCDWYDNSRPAPASGMRGGEIADIPDGVIVDLGGFVIQGVA